MSSPSESLSLSANRLHSLDAYRGLAMLLMISQGFGFPKVAEAHPESTFWKALAYQFEHVPWTGCALWDLIQPSFMFIVGVAVPFSLQARAARGESTWRTLGHGLVRSLILVLLAVMLYSQGRSQTNFTFQNVLAQIGLGYPIVLLLGSRHWTLSITSIVAILGGTWWLFHSHPVMTAEQVAAVGITANDWNWFTGYGAHWNKHTCWSAEMDRVILNWFPRPEPFVIEGGGYQTLNFLPAAATMLMGTLAGDWLLSARSESRKRNGLLIAGAVLLAVGLLIDHTLWPDAFPPVSGGEAAAVAIGPDQPFFSRQWTVCPAVKRIWTPTWAIFSAGWSVLLLGVFYELIDVRGWRAWAFPLTVAGVNSIALYLLDSTAGGWVESQLRTHVNWWTGRLFTFPLYDTSLGPVWMRLSVVFMFWLFAFWLFRKRVFFRI
jgi:predicted acyltransferase